MLNEIRGRPGMYLGAPSLVRLAAFLRGYEYGAEKWGGRSSDPFLANFRDWIHRRFQTTQHSWEETISLHSANEADAWERFWQLLDEFVEQMSSGDDWR